MAERLYVRLEGDDPAGPESGAPEGALTLAPVSGPLRRYVSSFLTYREDLSGTEVLERVLPGGGVLLVFNLGDAPSAGPSVGHSIEAVGASAAPALVRLSGRINGVSVALRAGAAAALLGVPAGELTDQAVHLDALWRGEASQVLERLTEARHDRERMQVLEAALLDRLRRSDTMTSPAATRAVQLFAESGGQLTVSAVADAVGVGERRLQQLFHTHVGLAPRAVRRLARLHACLRGLRGYPLPAWAQLASVSGYYDQAHLANEFRALCGITPSVFLEQAVSGSSKTAD